MLHDSVGQEVTRVVSRASSTLEGGLPCKSVDPGLPAPMDVAEGSSALEVAAAEGPTPKGVGAGSLSAASMDVHVGSPPVRSEEAVVTHVSTALADQVTLEASEPDARCLSHADGAEVTQVMLMRLFLLISPHRAMHRHFLLWVFPCSFPIFR
jgi:hypothetical protein